MDYKTLASALLQRADSLLPLWFPAGARQGVELKVGDLAGEAGQSLSINTHTGLWADFATGDKGGDLISLYAAKNDLSQLRAANELSQLLGLDAGITTTPVRMIPTSDVVMMVKPNSHAEGFSARHALWGLPAALYEYRDAADELTHFVARYESDGKKTFCPWRWDGTEWIARAPPEPRPLFGLELLARAPTAMVLLVEGEQCALAARRVLRPDKTLVLTWSGGAMATAKSDWAPLAGRRVNLWPDSDEPGRMAMDKIAGYLAQHRCAIGLIDTSDHAQGWDIADAIQQGWGAREIVDYARQRRRVIRAAAKVAIATAPVVTAEPSADADVTVPHAREVWAHYDLSMSRGMPWTNLDNVMRILSRHTTLWNALWFDEFRGRVMRGEQTWSETQDTPHLTLWMQRSAHLPKMSIALVQDGVTTYARTRARHPVREWLESLPEWDQVGRLDTLMHAGFGAAHNAYHTAVGRCFLIGMVARIYRPGCQLDTMPVFEGPQGVGKTQALRILGGEFYAANSESMQSKDFFQCLHGHWLVEISELESLSRASIERIKSVISTPSDVYRASYARTVSEYMRQCVFAGTTNSSDWNLDDTGARRFLPVACGAINLEWLAQSRPQLFAEALTAYRAGESWWQLPADAARQQAEARFEADPWEALVSEYLGGRQQCTVADVLMMLGLETAHRELRHARRAGRVLRRLGWAPKLVRDGKLVTKIFKPI